VVEILTQAGYAWVASGQRRRRGEPPDGTAAGGGLLQVGFDARLAFGPEERAAADPLLAKFRDEGFHGLGPGGEGFFQQGGGAFQLRQFRDGRRRAH
jgi:hypothetical protein